MKFNTALLILFLVFFAGIIIQVVLAFLFYLNGHIYSDDLLAILLNTLKVYSVHLAIIFSGTLFKQMEEKQQKIDPKVLWISLLLGGGWNALLICIMAVMFFIHPIANYTDFTNFQTKVSDGSAFLITGILSYFFVAKTQS